MGVSRVCTDDELRSLLLNTTTWAVVGLGNNPLRDAYSVAHTMQRRGKHIIPVHPTAVEVHGELVARTLHEAVLRVDHIDVVDCFVNSSRVGAIVDEAIEVGAGAVWMQLGVIDDAAAQRATSAGLTVVMNRCPMPEWRRLVPELP